MKVKGLDGKEHTIYLVGYQSKGSDTRPRSELHLQARELIKSIFKTSPLLEEVPIPGCESQLYADFFLPHEKIMIEVHGEQHYSYNSHFHGNKMDLNFYKSQKRDRDKKEWCEINGISLIVLPYDKDLEEWKTLLKC